MQTEVFVEPYVALSIIDHYMCREEGVRAEGYLLGCSVGGNVEIRGFVPSLDAEFVQLTQRAAPRDMAVGWYSTLLDDKDAMTLEAMERNIFRPIYLYVKVPSSGSAADITFRAFWNHRVTLSNGNESRCWKELPVTIRSADNDTAVALDTFVHCMFPTQAQASDPTSVPSTSDGEDPFSHLKQIKKNLETARTYVSAVLRGQMPGDKTVGRDLASLLAQFSQERAMLAASQDADGTSLVDAKIQDALMLQYISRLLQQQIAVLQTTANK